MKVDWLIVGCGFTGATFAERIASQLNQTVLIVEKRNHIGGNAYDYFDENGILVHKYGPHIFRTNSKPILQYLKSFCNWIPYTHYVQTWVDGQLIPIPFNLNSLYRVFPKTVAEKIETELIKEIGWNKSITIRKLLEKTSPLLQELSQFIYEKLYLNYTIKQWDLTPVQLSPSVTGRVPVRVNWDNRYFEDRFQEMPEFGFTRLFEKMLNHRNIKLLLQCDYREIEPHIKYKRMIYTGPIDEYFDCMFGPLPYRSLTFELKTVLQERVQPVAVINYPNDHLYTRITEFKHITAQKHPYTVLAYEFPEAYEMGKNIPYYPIPTDETKSLYKKYEKNAEKLTPKVIFAGRLADYQYYSMDQAVGRALKLFQTKVVNE